MIFRSRVILLLTLLILVGLTLSACNRERPAPATTTTTTPAAARGTVAAPTPATRGADAITPEAGGPGASTVATPSAPAPQQVAPSPAAAGGAATGQSFTYTVVAGDTLATIAARFGTTPEAITQLNSLADPNALTLGQKLQIPGTASAGQGASAGRAAAGGSTGTGGAAASGATTGGTSTYTVQQGDTLGAIAKRYGTTVQAIVAANGLANADSIKVGQKLTIPSGSGSGAAAAPSTSGGQSKNYTVQRGDTLLSIARRFGLTVKQLQAANNISNPDKIYPGQTLIIP